MQVQILSIEVNNKTSASGKPYEQLVVAYKDLSNGGKVASKTVMPFGEQKDTFTTLKQAKPVDVYDIEIKKNDAGYNDWIRAKKGTMVTASVTSASSSGSTTHSPTTKGGWETPEERARKQIYIIRQSSLSTAVAALSANVKVNPKAEEIIELARQFESYVLELDSPETTVDKDVGSIETMDEDIPY